MFDNITIYGASSADIDPRFARDAHEVGLLVARSGMGLICGGGRQGLMAAAIDGTLTGGGRAIGVLPRFMVDRNWQHPRLSEMVATDGMHPRKEWMLTHCRSVIALPGGIGTLEELLEAITWRQLNLWRGRIVILNTLGYYDPLIDMLQRSIDMRFMRGDHKALWHVASTPGEAVEIALKPVDVNDFSQKIH